MRVTQKLNKFLDWYQGNPRGVNANLARTDISVGKA